MNNEEMIETLRELGDKTDEAISKMMVQLEWIKVMIKSLEKNKEAENVGTDITEQRQRD